MPKHSLPTTHRTNPLPPNRTSSKPMKGIFRSLQISFSGTFYSNEKIIPHEKIAGWITHHGGKWVREVAEGTTHLICSIEDYKRKTAQVQKAWSLGKQKCSIVVLEWIEDSLLGPHGIKRLRAERGYTLDRTLARISKGRTDHEKFRARFEEGVRVAKDLCDSNLHHVYYDATGFEYKVVLTRINFNNKIPMERFTLFLFESHALPPTYMTGAKFSRSHRPLAYYRDTCFPKDFPSAFVDFKRFFQLKTGIEWDARLEPTSNKAPEAFTYKPPVLGRPVGVLPWGYVRPGLVEEKLVEKDEKRRENVVYDTDSEVDEEEEDDEERVEENIRQGAKYVVGQPQLKGQLRAQYQPAPIFAVEPNDNPNLDNMVICAASQSVDDTSTSFSVPASSQETNSLFNYTQPSEVTQVNTPGTSFSSVDGFNKSFSSGILDQSNQPQSQQSQYPPYNSHQFQHQYPPYLSILPISPSSTPFQSFSSWQPPPTFPLSSPQDLDSNYTFPTTNISYLTPCGPPYTTQTSPSNRIPTSTEIYIPVNSFYAQTGGGRESEEELDMNDIPNDKEKDKDKDKDKAVPEPGHKGKEDGKGVVQEPVSMEKGINREKYALEMARSMASTAAVLRGQMKGMRKGVYAGSGKAL